MIYFTTTDFIYDKDRIFRQLHLKENENVTKYIHHAFPRLIQATKENLELTTCYSIQDNDDTLDLPKIDCCKNIVFCFCSCSRKIDDYIQNLLENDDFLDGYLINHISNEVFFNASNQMNTQLEQALNNMGLKLTKRHSPGEDHIDLKYQETILKRIKLESPIQATLTEHFMIEPEKSMLYYFGADSEIESFSTKHDCKTCDSFNCPHRLID